MRLFSKPGCSACVGIKKILEAKGVEFTVVDISRDHEGGMEIVDLGFRSVPVLEVSGVYKVGESLREFAESL